MHGRRKRLGQDMDAPKRAYQLKVKPLNGGHAAGETINGRQLAEYAGTNQWGHHLWFWICPACEQRQGPAPINHLSRNVRCVTCRNKREYNSRWAGHEEIARSFISRYRADARKRGMPWELSDEQLWAKWVDQEGCCAYTGWALTHGVNASIDRIDSSRGYVPGNFQWLHKDVNWMKNAFTETYFLALCQAVAKHQTGLDVSGFDADVPVLLADHAAGRI